MRRLLLAVFAFAAILSAQPPATTYNALRWRFIGPFRGGRAVAATGVPGQPDVFYFGAVGGGIWKTVNAGMTWTPIFDDQHVASIGALEIAPSDVNILYAGTGEADIRSALSSGDGMYKSSDAGKTWRNIGLRESKQISRIAIHPKNPNLVYVAVLGHAYGPNEERGVFRSIDGGANWQRVLYKGPDVGATDIALDPDNPQVLYATMWQARRPPWSQYGPVEGPGGGLYKSTDAGDHWTQLTGNGLPDGGWHRSGVAVARGTRGSRVYAVIETTTTSGLFRSDDSGRTWTHMSTDTRIDSRAWYFSGVTVDPNNPDIVYLPNVAIYRSIDGGRNFTVLKGTPGGDDYHYLWVDPTNSARMIQASDQGVNISVDRGATWSSWYNQPTAQMYHVAVDSKTPYNVYGSQQDSGTVALPSRTDHGIISEYDRFTVGGAESGYIQPDPKDPNIFYVSNTYGTLTRFDKRTAQGQNITPWPAPAFGADIAQRKYRFPWTAPLVFSPVDHALYYGSQYVLKTVDGGLTWREISPDLTGADENSFSGEVTVETAKVRGYGVVYAIAPSPLSATLIWAGSDTGLIHLSRDGGKTWGNVTPKGLSDWSKITCIEASHTDTAEAYAAVDRHRLDDYTPHLYRTRDYGKTWTEITAGIENDRAFLNAVREDPKRKGLLYAATEFGVYVSFDDGDHWQSLQLNLPMTSVRDLVIHDDDVVAATHGRGFWILDDMSPLRQIDAKTADADAVLFKPAVATRRDPEAFLGTPLSHEIPQAANPPEGAILDYYLKSDAAGEVTLEILDGKNQVVRRYSTNDRPRAASRRREAIADDWIVTPPHMTARAGMNRFVWDLRHTGGPQVMPGAYRVRLTVAGKSYAEAVKVVLDPRSTATAVDLAKQFDLAMKISHEIEAVTQLMREIDEAKIPGSEKIRGSAGGRQSGTPPTGLALVESDLSAAKGVVDSSDRTPPAQAYALFNEAVANFTKLKSDWAAMKK